MHTWFIPTRTGAGSGDRYYLLIECEKTPVRQVVEGMAGLTSRLGRNPRSRAYRLLV
jgi:hypothetical protein